MIDLKIGIVSLATGRHTKTTPTRVGVKMEFSLQGRPDASIEMPADEAKALADSIVKALERRAEMLG